MSFAVQRHGRDGLRKSGQELDRFVHEPGLEAVALARISASLDLRARASKSATRGSVAQLWASALSAARLSGERGATFGLPNHERPDDAMRSNASRATLLRWPVNSLTSCVRKSTGSSSC